MQPWRPTSRVHLVEVGEVLRWCTEDNRALIGCGPGNPQVSATVEQRLVDVGDVELALGPVRRCRGGIKVGHL